MLVERLPDIPNLVTRATNDSVPRARIAGWSATQGRALRTRDVTARWPRRPEWFVGHPEWPLVVDLNTDGACEVIVPQGSSLESVNQGSNRYYGTPWGGLEVLDGRTGGAIWNRQLATMDQFLERFTVGPDIDDDGFCELYVAALWSDEHQLFIDCLSGADGTSLWRSHRSFYGGDSKSYRLGDLAWWKLGNDGWPQLMATAYDPQSVHGSDVERVVFSAGTGEITRLGSRLPHAAAADFDGDQVDDLCVFRVKPGPTQDHLDRGGSLQVVRGAQEAWRQADQATHCERRL